LSTRLCSWTKTTNHQAVQLDEDDEREAADHEQGHRRHREHRRHAPDAVPLQARGERGQDEGQQDRQGDGQQHCAREVQGGDDEER
jgi:hypothetical protein